MAMLAKEIETFLEGKIRQITDKSFRKQIGITLDATRAHISKMVNSMQIPGVYFLHLHDDNSEYKIGCTNNFKKRLSTHRTSHHRLEYYKVIYCDEHEKLEKKLHEAFSDQRTDLEWFNISNYDIDKWLKLNGYTGEYVCTKNTEESEEDLEDLGEWVEADLEEMVEETEPEYCEVDYIHEDFVEYLESGRFDWYKTGNKIALNKLYDEYRTFDDISIFKFANKFRGVLYEKTGRREKNAAGKKVSIIKLL